MEKTGDKIHAVSLREIVIHDGKIAKQYHQDLFSLHDNCYREMEGSILEAILAARGDDVGRLHISASWETILQVALWTQRTPAVHDVLALIRKSGITDSEIEPFRKSDVSDIFPWLYYGKRFDVLRKVCNAAKARAESKSGIKTLRIYCHIVSEGTGKIVASSL